MRQAILAPDCNAKDRCTQSEKEGGTVDVSERDNNTVRQHKLHFVFLNTKSGLPHDNDLVVRDGFFKAHLLAAGVRYRGPGQCQHTYTSQLLTTGIALIDWIAEPISQPLLSSSANRSMEAQTPSMDQHPSKRQPLLNPHPQQRFLAPNLNRQYRFLLGEEIATEDLYRSHRVSELCSLE
ncbi:hypothetical protein NLO83_16290 [Pseudomonas tremae]|nr:MULTISPECIES: hypothetical protein [Pseudomonas syringae group]MCQ3017141.1 hypothetical protein [Pseudomonas tremae]